MEAISLNASSIDPAEVEKFAAMAEDWWNPKGKFKPLHDLNPVRVRFIRDRAVKHFEKDADSLKPLTGLTLLDIGCGGGLLCEPMSRMGATVTGIDATEKNISVASLHAEQMGLNIDYRCMAAENLAEKAAYDIILALEVVEHVADVESFVKSISHLLKPGGILFMSTLNRTVKSYALAIVGAEYVLRWLPRGTHDWNKFLRPSELHAYLRHAGLGVKEMKGIVFSPISRSWSLSDNLDVNYLLAATRS